MDPDRLQELRARVAALLPYRRNPRPALAASFPAFMEGELQRAATVTANLVQAIKDLDERLAAIGA